MPREHSMKMSGTVRSTGCRSWTGQRLEQPEPWPGQLLHVLTCLVVMASASIGASAVQGQSAPASHYAIAGQPAAVASSIEPARSLAEPEPRIVAKSVGFPELRSPDDSDSGAATDEMLAARSSQRSKLTGTAITMGTSLVVVLGLFAGLVWVSRRFGGAGKGSRDLPNEVFRSLGGTAIDPRTRISLLRCGSKILVVSQTAGGMTPLAEITDPDEVLAITASCTGDAKNDFMQTLKSFEHEAAPKGFIAPAAPRGAETSESKPRGRLFANF